MVTKTQDIDYQQLHEDYFLLMEEYSGTELYKEIIEFMYLAFPEWTSNKGIGTWAAEFVLAAMQNLEYLYDDDKHITKENTFKDLYLTLVDDFNDFKSSYTFSFQDRVLNDFENEYTEFLEDNEHLPETDFKALYNELYNKFYEVQSKKVIYNFRDEDALPKF